MDMAGLQKLSRISLPFTRQINWRGGSGRIYGAWAETVDHFVFNEASVYVLVVAGQAAWVGTAHDLINDPVSRGKFRGSVHLASVALRLDRPDNEIERMGLMFDLEAGHQIAELTAA